MSGRASEQLAKGTPLVAGAPKANGSTGGFNLNYDVNTPVRAIDVGGPDQAQKSVSLISSFISRVFPLFGFHVSCFFCAAPD